jgi:hypothetical protein
MWLQFTQPPEVKHAVHQLLYYNFVIVVIITWCHIKVHNYVDPLVGTTANEVPIQQSMLTNDSAN